MARRVAAVMASKAIEHGFRACAGGLDRKRKHFIEGGQAGNREQYINNLVRVMN